MDFIQSLQFTIVSVLILSLMACDKSSDPLQIRKETEHFVLITNSELSSTAEIDAVLTKAENLYEKILGILGESHRPQKRITIRLKGDFTGQGPYFDNLGIHLYRYSSIENGYLSALAHEMIHAFHEPYYIQYDAYSWEGYPFLDEGLAEYVAQLVDETKTGFPWYGFNEYAVVGDLVLAGNWIPMDTLRVHHDEINQPCHIQAYTQRASWMRYIDETYGRDTLLIMSYPTIDPTHNFFVTTLGVDLMTVDSSWRAWVIEKYNSTPQADQIAAAFRERTNWYDYCDY